jgi:hypothetical protein
MSNIAELEIRGAFYGVYEGRRSSDFPGAGTRVRWSLARP